MNQKLLKILRGIVNVKCEVLVFFRFFIFMLRVHIRIFHLIKKIFSPLPLVLTNYLKRFSFLKLFSVLKVCARVIVLFIFYCVQTKQFINVSVHIILRYKRY